MRFLFISLFTVWTFFSWWYYTCEIKHACLFVDNPANANTITDTELPKPLNFRWSSYQIPLDSGFPDLKEAILAQQGNRQLLKITGYYFLNESEQNSSFDLGLARASEVKKLLLNEFSEDQIAIYSAILPAEALPTDSLVEAIQFEWTEALPNIDTLAEVTEEEVSTEEDGEVFIDTEEPFEEEEPVINEEVANTDYFIKYFPYNQTRIPSELVSFLDDLAKRILAEDKKVVIRGHTDSIGDKEMNFKVGLRRAKKVRDELMDRGVPKSKIETTSSGEDEPIADNKTEEGRQQNRRIEILIKE